ncbi:YiiX/YebB-like N1pC/P60 family cysteine hydrolase [Pseudothauera lacus]|uniref:Distant relative of cell wall-associated hydrolase n=1 Tax=Pseudothauera lacus TaxID=2136175 RepID=A0A2T4IDD0_9RHOO|nr:YiiX/YebB-like N1pC/P60 family cysteine hydrolase [Pseudothauera lacus]PTD95781.1 distant relative of cell wall-associated hydrolase [Pseudothauera lacus]
MLRTSPLRRPWRLALAALALVLGACATQVQRDGDGGAPRLQIQSALLLAPGNGGVSIAADELRPGDIILSATKGTASIGIRVFTLAPVSHAALYIGDGEIVEAVGSGVQVRTVARFIDEESTVVAFRHPAIEADHAARLRDFARAQVGSRYNAMGVVLQAPFSVQRRLCELPLAPTALRDACIRGLAAIQLGAVRNDRFFCSQLVLEAYRRAELPLTAADPRLISPADILHMREGDVPSVRIHQALEYVGHLRFTPPPETVAGRL